MANKKLNSNIKYYKKKSKKLPVIFMGILSLFWIAPILVVILNSFKKKAYIFKNPFGISSKSLADGFEKWKNGISKASAGFLNYEICLNASAGRSSLQ